MSWLLEVVKVWIAFNVGLVFCLLLLAMWEEFWDEYGWRRDEQRGLAELEEYRERKDREVVELDRWWVL